MSKRTIYTSLVSALLLVFLISKQSWASGTLNFPKDWAASVSPTKPVTIQNGSHKQALTLEPYIQEHLQNYIVNHFSPIAAVVLVEVKSGKVLAFAQGRKPSQWKGEKHTALHNLFPAASLFKTVVTTAAFEVADMNPDKKFGLKGGCGTVHRGGIWMQDLKPRKHFQMTLRRAYGLSCNGFFAKIAINELGLNVVNHYANLYGWNNQAPADFEIPISPLRSPEYTSASALTVGKFAAGFGYVGMSAAHAAWMTTAIARQGKAVPLQIQHSATELPAKQEDTLITSSTSRKILDIMDSTVRGGTAHFAFQRRKFWRIRREAGGKTGTLTGDNPKGMTTWFAGVMPLKNPEVAVAAVVVLDDLWHIKGANLAAEAFYAYKRMKQKKKSLFQTTNTAKSELKGAH